MHGPDDGGAIPPSSGRACWCGRVDGTAPPGRAGTPSVVAGWSRTARLARTVATVRSCGVAPRRVGACGVAGVVHRARRSWSAAAVAASGAVAFRALAIAVRSLPRTRVATGPVCAVAVRHRAIAVRLRAIATRAGLVLGLARTRNRWIGKPAAQYGRIDAGLRIAIVATRGALARAAGAALARGFRAGSAPTVVAHAVERGKFACLVVACAGPGLLGLRI